MKIVKKAIHLITSPYGFGRCRDEAEFRIRKNAYLKNESKGNGGSLRVAQVTYPLTGNAGDTVLSYCVRRMFERFYKIDRWELIAVDEPVTVETIKTVNLCDFLVIGGGGLFLPDTNENDISGWQWAISDELLNDISVPVCVYSVGYNYFPHQIPSDLFKHSLRLLVEKSCFFGLRNHGSVEAVKCFLTDELKGKVVYQPCTTTLSSRIVDGVGTGQPEKTAINSESGKCRWKVALNMAFDREDRRFGTSKERILTEVAKGIKELQDSGSEITYVCHSRSDDRILAFLDRAEVKYSFVDMTHWFPDRVLCFYEKMDLVIGMRGHAQMIPFGVNVPILSLGTHDKMRWFLEDIDSEDWYMDITKDIGEIGRGIADKSLKILNDEDDEIRKHLCDQQDRLWRISVDNMEMIQKSTGGTVDTVF